MKLTRESPRYNKIQIRSEQAKRWARLRGEHPRPEPQSPDAAKHIAGFFEADKDKSDLKRAGIGALLVHFLVFFLVIPERATEIVPIERTAATVVKRYTPPSPPAKAKKTPKKKKSRPLPIPDPTPDEPEPIREPEPEIEPEPPMACRGSRACAARHSGPAKAALPRRSSFDRSTPSTRRRPPAAASRGRCGSRPSST